jgi:hypothetical protein
MLNLFVPTAPFHYWGEDSSGPMNRLSRLIAGLMVIVSLAALTLTLCRVLAMLSSGELFAFPEGLSQIPSRT